MSQPRQFDIAEFFRDTLAPGLASIGRREPSLILGIDEGLNNPQYVGTLAADLVACGIASESIPLWYAQRKTKDGQKFSVLGNSVSKSLLMPDIGRTVPGASWPDEGVVALLVVNFLKADRVCLLTQNTKRDRNGLRDILESEVARALSELRQLGLLVLAQKPGSKLKEYAAAVRAQLSSFGVPAGFQWKEI
jgi:hypothetical protein